MKFFMLKKAKISNFELKNCYILGVAGGHEYARFPACIGDGRYLQSVDFWVVGDAAGVSHLSVELVGVTVVDVHGVLGPVDFDDRSVTAVARANPPSVVQFEEDVTDRALVPVSVLLVGGIGSLS